MEVEKALNTFWTDVIIGAKKNLKKDDKVASKALFNSLEYNVKVSKNSFETSFSMEDYGIYVEQGVKGIGGKKANGDTWKLKKFSSKTFFSSSPFKYKTGIENKPSSKHFDKWTIRKGIAPRTKGGQFTTRKGINAAISQSVWHTGLLSTHFFSIPFEKEFKELPEKLVEAYGLTVDKLLQLSLA